MRPQGTDTPEGSIAATWASTGVYVAWLVGIALFAGPDISLLAALVLVFAVAASWACAYVFVGALVDALVWRHRGRR